MNRDQRRSLKRLPLSKDSWEVLVVDAPFEVPDAELAGMLVVVEHRSGDVRVALPFEAGESLGPLLHEAFKAPSEPCSPGRPQALLFEDSGLAERVRALLGKSRIPIQLVERAERAREFALALGAHMSEEQHPIGITIDPAGWNEALEAFWALRPWETLQSVAFFFHEPDDLAGAAALLVMDDDGSPGVVIYPSHAAQQAAAIFFQTGSLEALRGHWLYWVTLADPERLDATYAGRCEAIGLRPHGGRYPNCVHLSEHGPQPIDTEQELNLIQAVESINAMARRHGDALLTQSLFRRAPTTLDDLLVQSLPIGATLDPFSEPDLLFTNEYSFYVGNLQDEISGHGLPCLALRMTKANAVRLSDKLQGIHIIEFVGRHATEELWAYDREGNQIGLLLEVEGPEQAQALDALLEQDQVLFAVSAGGTKRESLRTDQFTLLTPVTLDIRLYRPGTVEDTLEPTN